MRGSSRFLVGLCPARVLANAATRLLLRAIVREVRAPLRKALASRLNDLLLDLLRMDRSSGKPAFSNRLFERSNPAFQLILPGATR